MNERIIILGSNGQIGTELAISLRNRHGIEQVLMSDINPPADITENFERMDVLNKDAMAKLFTAYKPTQVYLLAALLSAVGEKYPKKAWDLNMNGLLNVLDLALEHRVKKVFWPSSIAVFGPHSPKSDTPQYCTMDPNTVYGLSKLSGERWCEYYFQKYGLDVRSIRYPGLISWKAAPGGGTTDYAIHIYIEALKRKRYECFLSKDTKLPMLFMDDAIKGTLALMDAPGDNLRIRSSYNMTGMTFTPEELGNEIRKHIPDFKLDYEIDEKRQAIADSWPGSIDDRYAREDWNWQPSYGVERMTTEMLKNIKIQ